jgi:hypothetical protein
MGLALATSPPTMKLGYGNLTRIRHRDHCHCGATLVLMLVSEIDTLWIILGAAVISLSASSLGLIHQM